MGVRLFEAFELCFRLFQIVYGCLVSNALYLDFACWLVIFCCLSFGYVILQVSFVALFVFVF